MQQAHLKSIPQRDGSTEPHGDVTQEHELWTTFAEASTAAAFCQSWLALQCRMIDGVRAGMVLLGPPGRGPCNQRLN